ncbi:hypothetical protein MLD38_039354 [Melastoma candidum]|uniref:Uncharacterized protein n=1 Tax=Melastoma candidum TaxID=119954 RepID=A0ACB9L304_9MYRT|nr:hypothetical protein MLD38_039354 [Melastoma candidum]
MSFVSLLRCCPSIPSIPPFSYNRKGTLPSLPHPLLPDHAQNPPAPDEMAVQEANPASIPSAEVVGNAFVEQYYHILHQSPGMVHRFYQDSSLLSRPDANGVMSTVTTMQAINEKIVSLNYEEYTVEIKTADAQRSHEKGVIVLVTGCLTGKDNARRKFTQTFFLAPQDNGYFVLNDVLRYIGESEPLVVNAATNANAPAADTVPEESIHVPDPVIVEPVAGLEEEDLNDGAEVCDPSDYEGSVVEDAAIEPIHPTAESAPDVEEDAPKKSYASIVKVMQGLKMSRPVHAPSDKTEVGSANNVQQSIRPTSPKPEGPAAAKSGSAGAPAPGNDSMPESSNANEEVEGYSIYVRNLPINATVEQLGEAFQRFGSIKPNGIQVRNAKQGSCFGFVEFEALVSMQSALQASPITIGDRPAVIEEKRTTTRVGSSGSSRGRYPPGRGGFRSDSFRARGNYIGGGRGYGRSEYRSQGEFSGRPRGGGRGGESYQRVYHNTGGTGGRQV